METHTKPLSSLVLLGLVALLFMGVVSCQSSSTSGREDKKKDSSKKEPTQKAEKDEKKGQTKVINLPYADEFPHDKHLKEGTKEECLQCHRWKDSGQISIQFTCNDCHNKERNLKFETKEVSLPSLFTSFDHGAHRKMKCSECHQRQDSGEYKRLVAFDNCTQCHSRHESYEKKQDCLKCHIPPLDIHKSKRGQIFSHKEHVTEKGDNCTRCHEGIGKEDSLRASFATVNTQQAITSQCRQCHGESSQVEFQTKKVPHSSFKFSHKIHLAKNQDCQQCHIWKEGKVHYKGKLPRYEGCLECHTDWKVKKHGDLTSCQECHHPQNPSQMRKVRRPKFDNRFVLKRDVDEFHKAHSMKKGNCKKCHIKNLSRPKAKSVVKKFRHVSHLPPPGEKVPSKTCLSCHLVYSSSPGEVQTQGCTECHSKKPQMKSEVQGAKEGPLFDHNQHKSLDCNECHDRGNSPEFQKVKSDCVSCHRPGTATDKKLKIHQGCFKCHDNYQMFSQPSFVLTQIREIKLSPVKYEHSMAGDCQRCHVEKKREKKIPRAVNMVRQQKGLHNRPPDSCNKCHLRFGKK